MTPDDLQDKLDKLITWTHKDVTDQIEKLRAAANAEGTKGTSVESSILGSVVSREAAAVQAASAMLLMTALKKVASTVEASTEVVGAKVEGLANLMAASEKHLAERVDAFTSATDASTKQLARWTKVMAWATIALAVFAVAQVVVAVIAIFHTP